MTDYYDALRFFTNFLYLAINIRRNLALILTIQIYIVFSNNVSIAASWTARIGTLKLRKYVRVFFEQPVMFLFFVVHRHY
jgi:hypothetical protein